MNGIYTIRQIFCLSKTVLVTSKCVTLRFLCIGKAACGFKIYFKNSTCFGCFNLCIAIIGVFNDGNIPFDNLFIYIICGLIMLDSVKFRLCADLVNSRIKQVPLAWLQFFDRPVWIADIFLCCKLSVFVGVVFVNELFAFKDSVFCICERSITLSCSGFSVALGNGNGKLLQDIGEITGSDLIPLNGCRLIFRNNIANCSVHFLNGIWCCSANQHIFKDCCSVFISNSIFVYLNTGKRSAIQVEGDTFVEIIFWRFNNFNVATL